MRDKNPTGTSIQLHLFCNTQRIYLHSKTSKEFQGTVVDAGLGNRDEGLKVFSVYQVTAVSGHVNPYIPLHFD